MPLIRYEDSTGSVHYAAQQSDGAFRIAGDPFKSYAVTNEPARIARLLAPVVPSQIFCIGLNYRRHAEESKMTPPTRPVLFMKGVNAVQAPGAPIVLPRALRSDEVDYEAELAVVIGRACKNVSRAHALDYVLGYTCANDVSARDWQLQREKAGGQWCRGKTFDTFCPLGPALIEFLSASTTLLPGTVILTGTPQGVGMAATPPRWLRAGDHVVVEIDHIGRLENPVVEETVISAPAVAA